MGTALVALCSAASLDAQTLRERAETQRVTGLTSILMADVLADLPFGETVYAVLETTQAEVIADTFNSGGQNVGASARAGGFLGSWSQTQYRLGDVNVSDPSSGGAPLLFPELFPLRGLEVRTGLMSAGLNTPGLGVKLDPMRPGTTWTKTIQASGSGGGLTGDAPAGAPPPIVRLDKWSQGSALFSGPLSPGRVGLVVGGSWARSSSFAREQLPTNEAERASGFFHVVDTVAPDVEWRALGWLQRTRVPFAAWQSFGVPDASTRDVSVHVQSTWEHRVPGELQWRVFGAHTGRSRDNTVAAARSIVVERLEDGPVPALVGPTADSTVRRWSFGGRAAPAMSGSETHTPEFGLDVERTTARDSGGFDGLIAERVDGLPARLWEFIRPAAGSERHATTMSLFAADKVTLSPRATLDAGVRLESVRGQAKDARDSVSWLTVLPHAMLRWQFRDAPPLAFVAGYARSANQLTLDWLAVGDPHAQTGIVSRWLGTPLPPAPGAPIRNAIIDVIGPGTGGNPDFARIAPGLKRPYTDEVVVGLESLRHRWLRVSMLGIARREANVMGVVDTGVPLSSYSTIGIADPGHDFNGAEDDQVLTIYNRLPSSFARNQYVLDNPAQKAATSYAFKIAADGSTDRVYVLIGATASMATGSSANRGFGPLENDQDAIGDLFTNPNAATFARGRLFSDRAFTAKWTTVYRFPADLHVGVIARYQDGQPFSRYVIAPSLTQGPEIVRAYPNGGNRFTFTGTLDLRVWKGVSLGKGRADAILDVYNLVTRSNEVEEYFMTGPNFRTPTAIEPRPSVHLGLRVTF